MLLIFSTACFVALIFVSWWAIWQYKNSNSEVRLSADVSVEQLQQHQEFYIALCERVHLDPSIRQTLKHQQRVLKTIGVVSNFETIDVTESSKAIELNNNNIKEIAKVKYDKIDLDEVNRQRGFKVLGD